MVACRGCDAPEGVGVAQPALESRFGEVGLGVFQVVVSVHADEFEVGFVEGAADLGRNSGDKGMGRDLHALRDDRARGHDRAGADVRSIEYDRAHADENFVLEGAAVDGGIVSDSAHIADDDRMQKLHAVQDGAILDIGTGADTDVVYITAQDGVHPDAGVVTEDDIAYELGGGIHVASGWNDGTYIAVRTKHGCEFTN